MTSVALGPRYREDALHALADREFDVLVVGGGIVGAGTALDAVSRGLSVALVEARDWAAGTSSRSSKLIHGGLRYLEQRDFGLVREALRERGLLLHRLAPHLVRPVQFLYPLRNRVWERAYVSAGVTLYDTLGGARALPRHRQLTKRGALREAPALRADALVGAIQYHDAQVDDARYTLMVARTAAQYGAKVVTRAEATGFLREGERVTGAQVLDLEGGQEIAVRAKRVVCATGVWTDGAQAMTGSRASLTVRASKGVHLVVPRNRIPMDTGLITRTSKSVLLIIPWGRHWLIGTTDTPHEHGPDGGDGQDGPVADHTDIGYLLDQANAVLRTPLTHDDIEGVYAGLRPLLSAEVDDTTRLSREHAVAEPVPGLVVVTGGKFTTYRVMARDAVDAVAGGLDDAVPGSVTGRLPILGAVGFEVLWNERRRLAAESGLHVARVEHLLRRYGSCAREVLDLVAEDPTLGAPVPGAEDYLCAEAVYAVTHEGAMHLEDVLSRRLRVSIEEWDGGVAAASHVADLLAPRLAWGTEDVTDEIKRYVLQIRTERRDTPSAA
ncbi:MAG: glycerol-3-phosphate dehydrogenase/oxidase [Spirillospora sp.]